jgi:aldose 1-epimerase
MITLSKGELEAVIDPATGGSLTRFAAWGVDVLRPTPKTGYDVRGTCCFPLVPYANRIAKGLLHFEGRAIHLALNFGDHPHSLHGHGWQTAWRVETLAADRAVLAYDYKQGDWPWAYSAEEVFTLEDDALAIKLSLRNRDTSEMPFSLGFHPYFPRNASTRLTATVAGMWEADATMLPTDYIANGLPIDLAHGGAKLFGAPFVDNCFPGWKQPARIDQPESGYAVSLEATEDCTFLHCFVPVGESFFCAEPVTTMPNAYERPEPASTTGARALEPGESFSIEMRLRVIKQ